MCSGPFDGPVIADVPCVQGRSRLEQEHCNLLLGRSAGAPYYAARRRPREARRLVHGTRFGSSRTTRNISSSVSCRCQMNGPANLTIVLMPMPDERAGELDHFDLLTVQLGHDSRLAVIVEEGRFSARFTLSMLSLLGMKRGCARSRCVRARHRRSAPMRRSAYGFCHGDLAAVTTSSIPSTSIARRNCSP